MERASITAAVRWHDAARQAAVQPRFRFAHLGYGLRAMERASITAAVRWHDAVARPQFKPRFRFAHLGYGLRAMERISITAAVRWHDAARQTAVQPRFRFAPSRLRASPYEKSQQYSCFCASATQLYHCLFSHCSLININSPGSPYISYILLP
jgi:hypothetical protein